MARPWVSPIVSGAGAMLTRLERPMPSPVVDILMYHSIAEGVGPSYTPPAVFEAQMDAIAKSGIPVLTLDDLVAARAGAKDLPQRSIVITFDDGYLDFAETAYPILERHGFACTVYIATSYIGGIETWPGGYSPPRRVMDWDHVDALSKKGIQFGSHSVKHIDLNAMNAQELLCELRSSKAELEDKLGKQVDHFSPPYGIADHYARTQVGRIYKTSVGTIFDRVTVDSDVLDLPRLEMYYYLNPDRWRAHLAGEGETYMKRRQMLRYAREVVSRSWEGA